MGMIAAAETSVAHLGDLRWQSSDHIALVRKHRVALQMAVNGLVAKTITLLAVIDADIAAKAARPAGVGIDTVNHNRGNSAGRGRADRIAPHAVVIRSFMDVVGAAVR